jgi:PAS domain S-box-containing protein
MSTPVDDYQTSKETDADFFWSEDDLRAEARKALSDGNVSWLQDKLDRGEINLTSLTENLQIYQTELEIQNEELRAAQQHATESLAHYKRLFSELPEAALLINPAGLILDVNAEAIRVFGLSYWQLHQHFLQRLLCNYDEHLLPVVIERAQKNNSRQIIRASLLTSLRKELICELHFSRLTEEQEDHHCKLICIIIDLTDHEESKARLDLQHRRASYQLMLPQLAQNKNEKDFLEQALTFVEKLTDSTLAFGHFVNEEQDTLSTASWSEDHRPSLCASTTKCEYAIQNIRLWAEVIHSHKPIMINNDEQFIEQTKLPFCCHIELTRLIIVPVIDDGLVRLVCGVANKSSAYTEQDIDSVLLIADNVWRIIHQRRTDAAILQQNQELVKAQTKSQQLMQVKNEFIANISHEIRTPMNAIMNLNALVLQTDLTHQQRDYIEKVHQQSQHLMILINDLLDFSKIEAGQIQFKNEKFDLKAVLADLSNLITGLAKNKPISIRFDFTPDISRYFKGDRQRLTQILNNLLDNAIKFTIAGQVTLSIRQVAANTQTIGLEFAVTDTGIGLTREQIKKIFKSFRQVDGGINRKYAGTGLGLVICQRLIRLLGGKLKLTSQPNHGSRFYFTLPLTPVIPGVPLMTHEEIGSLINIPVVIGTAKRHNGLFLLNQFYQLGWRDLSDYHSITAIQHHFHETADQANALVLLILDTALAFDKDNTDKPLQQLLKTLSNDDKNYAYTLRIILVSNGQHDGLTMQRISSCVHGYLDNPITSLRLLNTVRTAVTNVSDSADQLATDRAEKPRILIVDDQEINRVVAKRLLQPLQLTIDLAHNGAVALKQLRTHHYDLVLLDLQMPEMDGYETFHRIRHDLKLQQLPVIAMTAHSLLQDKNRCLEKGMNDFISKPIDMQQLYQVLHRWLALSKLNLTVTELNVVLALLKKITIKHLDYKTAIHRLNDDIIAYHKVLTLFLKEHQETPRTFQEACDRNDHKSACHIVHAIKGSSAQLGAYQLSQRAATLEQRLLAQQQPAVEQVTDFLQQLAEVCSELQSIIACWPQYTEADSSHGTVDLAPENDSFHHDCLEQLQRLSQLLDEDMIAARRLMEQIQRHCARMPWQQHTVQSIADALNEFDIDVAQTLITQVLQTSIIEQEVNSGLDKGVQ